MTLSTDRPTNRRPWMVRTLFVILSLALGSSALVAAQSTTTTTTPSTTLPLYEAYLKASNTEAGDGFGLSIAVDGDTIVVGAPFEDSATTGINGNQADNSATNAGAVYVFVRSGTTWTQQAYLKASNTDAGDEFGYAVTITEDTLIISAPFEDSAASGINGDQTNNSALDSGAAYVFVRSGSTWTQQAYLKASNAEAGDGFGFSLTSDTNQILVGAPFEDSGALGSNGGIGEQNNELPSAGAAYLFHQLNGLWTQEVYLKTNHRTIEGSFGYAVAMEAGTIVIGSPYAKGYEQSRVGLISIFVYQESGWHHSQMMESLAPDPIDGFGQSVAINNQRIAVGASGEDSNATLINGDNSNNAASNAGAVYIYDRHPAFYEPVWHPTTYIKASNTEAVDNFGYAVAFCGSTVLSGARGEDSAAQGTNGNQTNNSLPSAGAVYRYIWNGAQWQHRHYNKALNPDALDYFGTAIACDDQLLAISAPGEDSAAQGVNGDQTDNSAPDAGAVYVLSLPMQGYTHLPAVTGEETLSPYPLPQR